MIKCPNCQKNPAIIHKVYGVTECEDCKKKQIKFNRPVEFTTESIKEQRREYKKDILQPFRDGVLSKEYLEEYGRTGINVTDEEVKNAKYTYKDTTGWWTRNKTKGGRQNAWKEKNVDKSF